MEHADVAPTARRIRDAGLQVSSYCRSSYLTASTSEEFRSGIEDNRRVIDEAAMLEAATMILVVGGLPSGSKDLARARAQVEEGIALLLNYARGEGVRLAVEPLHPMHLAERSCINTLAQALAICDRLDPRSGNEATLGICVDVYHCWWDPELARLLRQAGQGGRIFNFQICDWLVPTQDMLLDRGMMGDGAIDLPSIRAEVEAAGYRDFVEIEIFSANDWWERSASEILTTCRERIATCC
jgi:sugar phosphate isomerase/epimerase